MVVLRIGSAMAVLARDVPANAGAHDAAATMLLRRATGRGDIHVERRPSGRPRLLPPHPELAVSLSYRDGLLLVGFDPAMAVGVDLEFGSAIGRADPVGLVSDHFAPAETAAVAMMCKDRARDMAMRLWVAKEAALKLTGRGVFDGLAEPDLSAHLGALAGEGQVIALAQSGRMPAIELVVGRPAVEGLDERPFCGLARAVEV
jgi:4'-phosphopantetheinyl transferase